MSNTNGLKTFYFLAFLVVVLMYHLAAVDGQFVSSSEIQFHSNSSKINRSNSFFNLTDNRLITGFDFNDMLTFDIKINIYGYFFSILSKISNHIFYDL
jgi:hypothetical protein